MGKGMSGHQATKGNSDHWLTPPEIIEALGSFDLDPATPEQMPWQTALTRYTEHRNGLLLPWFGLVWLNPPYSLIGKFMELMAWHGRGTALVFARTETDWFNRYVWQHATAILFLRGRLHFHHLNGDRAKANAGAPSALIAYGEEDARILEQCGLKGRFVRL